MANHTPPSSHLVSIILPTYNRAAYLPRCINSVVAQTYPNWELIVIDDGSTDDTKKVLQPYRKRDHRIRYYAQTNQGPALASNHGISRACGSYVTFIDSDDEYTATHVARRLAYLLAHPAVDITHGGLRVIGDPYVQDKDDLTKKIHVDRCVVRPSIMSSRKIFQALGGFRDIPYSEESEFIERAKKKYRVRRVYARTYIYHRETPGSITNTMAAAMGTVVNTVST